MISERLYRQTSFRAMGTDITVIVADVEESRDALGEARDLFARQERRFSRFIPDSELSTINSGVRHIPSQDFRDVLKRAARWHSITNGDFDPSVLPQLINAGYDRSFEKLADRKPESVTATQPWPGERHVFADVCALAGSEFEEIQLPHGAQIDLSGIVKSWTADRAAELLSPLGHFVVDAGGDIAARGDSPDDYGWWVGIEDPEMPGFDCEYVNVQNGSVATSGTYRRRWATADGRHAHHVIDPHTGKPSASSVVAVAVTGSTTEECEIYARTALIRGPVAGMSLIHSVPNIEAMMTLDDGERLCSDGWSGLKAYRPHPVGGVSGD